jgi:imidazolonepropionase-like amidohydrolase
MAALRRVASVCAALALCASAGAQSTSSSAPRPGERGGAGLALLARKALTAKWEGEQAVDDALVLVKDGRIEAIGPRAESAVPAGYAVRDLGPLWLMPGIIDLHCHTGGSGDINDMVYVTNPELRVHCSVLPRNPNFLRQLAAGVTSVLFIPGSGTNSGGQGILLKTGLEHYEDCVIRDPGSLKVAQWGNPERWAIGVGKTFENFHLREMFTQGRAYAKGWSDYEAGKGPKPERDPRLDVFRDLFAHKTQVSTHTQVAQVVMMTLFMIRGEFGLDVYIDHGEFGGYLYADLAREMGVPAILGPRNVDCPDRQTINWVGINPERFEGLAAAYQAKGLEVGFNTDCPVIPGEEVFLQSAIGVRFGMQNERMQAVRGLTIVPARAAGIADRVGSLEPGKDADIVIISGDPSDPRSHVEGVYVSGQLAYDPTIEGRRF